MSSSADISKKLWFETGPLKDAGKITALSLTTKSRHQGFVDFPENGSWSWFEVAILSEGKGYGPEIERIRSDDEGLMTYKSHDNRVTVDEDLEGLDLRDHNYSSYTGNFGTHHPIWGKLREGDSLGVFGCVRQPNWKCLGRAARLELYHFDGDCVA